MAEITEEQLATLEHHEAIQEQRAIIRNSLVEYNEAKEAASAKKKRYEADVAELQQLIDEDPKQKKLFSPSDCESTKKDANQPEPTSEGTLARETPDSANVDWKTFDVNNLQNHAVTEKQCEKLGDYNIQTLNDLYIVINEDPGDWWVDYKGIGKTAAAKIDAALSEIINASSAAEAEDSDEDAGDGENSNGSDHTDDEDADSKEASSEEEQAAGEDDSPDLIPMSSESHPDDSDMEYEDV